MKWDTVCWIVFFTSFLSSSSVSGTCRKQYLNLKIDIKFCVQIHSPSCPAWRDPAVEWVHPSCCIPGKCRRQEGPRQLQGNLVKVVFIRQQWNWKWEHMFKTMSNYNNHGFLEVLKGGSVSSNELLKVTMYEIQHLFASLWVFWQLCKRLGMI